MFGVKPKIITEAVAQGNLVEGLPLPIKTDLIIKLVPEALTITGLNQEFEISFEKLILVDSKSEQEMEKIVQQSAPGMVIGALTFGVLGAMVGGRVKTKNKRVVRHFLIISYQSDDLKTIVIETTKDWYNGAAMVDFYRSLAEPKEVKKISL